MIHNIATWAILAQFQLARAAVAFTNDNYYIRAGEPFKITWANNRGAVTISLMYGPDVNLQPVLVIVSRYRGSEFVWTPPLALPPNSYELEIRDSATVDYSKMFQYLGPDGDRVLYLGTAALSTLTSSESSIRFSEPPIFISSSSQTPQPAPSPSNSLLTTATTSASTTRTIATTTPTETSTTDAASLPPRAKAALATVGTLLLLALLALFGYLAYRNRRQKRAGDSDGTGSGGSKQQRQGQGQNPKWDQEPDRVLQNRDLAGDRVGDKRALVNTPTTTTFPTSGTLKVAHGASCTCGKNYGGGVMPGKMTGSIRATELDSERERAELEG